MGGLTRSEVDAALASFVAMTRETFGAALLRLTLFGSRARGDADEYSDVDVLVVLKHVDGVIKRKVLDLAGDVFVATAVVISPVVYDEARFARESSEQRPLVASIAREGITL